MRPPTPSDASRSCTGTPASCSATAAVRPAIPAPTTITGRSGVGRGYLSGSVLCHCMPPSYHIALGASGALRHHKLPILVCLRCNTYGETWCRVSDRRAV